MSQSVKRFVSQDLTLRASAVDATHVVREMQQLQKTLPLATLAVGRAMVGSLLMASQLKEGQQVGILFRGNGPLKSIYAEAHFTGEVRGFCPQPQYEEPNKSEALRLSSAIGKGTLTVARHQPYQRQPFHGTVEIVSGEVAEDLAHYLHQSHQIRSVISLGVYLNEFGQVQSAGGVLVEVMPGVEDQVVDLVQANFDQIKTPLSKLLKEGSTAEEILQPYLKGIPLVDLPHPHPIRYFCPCTEDRVLDALGTLGVPELQEMIRENEKTQVTCQVCGRPYELGVERLQTLVARIQKESLH